MDALRQIKRITDKGQKIGHGGTIDPLAKGVLPVCLGQATRLMDYVIASVKSYRVEITLGITTTTYDADGEVVKTSNISNITQKMVEESIKPWIGIVNQTPPMYSAVKMDGKRLYKLARAGADVDVARKTRPVSIHGIKVLEFVYPKLVMEVECGKGTYIRSLAHDLGESLGCGGHIADLIRLQCGSFQHEDSVTLEQLEKDAAGPYGWQKHLFQIDRVLLNLKSLTLLAEAEERLRHGQPILAEWSGLESVRPEERRAYNSRGIFIGLVRSDQATNTWKPIKIFQLDTPSPYACSSR